MDSVQGHYHPLLFLLMALVAVAELGLTAFLISVGNEIDWWASSRYHALYVSDFLPLIQIPRLRLASG